MCQVIWNTTVLEGDRRMLSSLELRKLVVVVSRAIGKVTRNNLSIDSGIQTNSLLLSMINLRDVSLLIYLVPFQN
jgi:hypothetical protein